MKPSVFTSLLLVTFCSVPLTVHSQGEPSPLPPVAQTAIQASAGPEAVTADGKVWLRLNLQPDQMFSARLVSNFSTTTSPAVKGKTTHVEMTFLLRVLGSAPNGDTRIRLTLSSLDSDATPSTRTSFLQGSMLIPVKRLAEIYTNAEVVLHLDARGNVTSIDGLGKLVNLLPPGTGPRPADVAQFMQMQLREFTGISANGLEAGIPWLLLPQRLIGPDDSWVVQSREDLGDRQSSVNRIASFKVAGRKDGVLSVDSRYHEALAPEKQPYPYMKAGYWVSGQGSLEVDEKTGFTRRNFVKRRSKFQRKVIRPLEINYVYEESDYFYECTPIHNVTASHP